MRTLIAILLTFLTATSSAFARRASHHYSHHSKQTKVQPVATTDPAGVARDPDDVALDRKIGSICRGC